MQFFTAAGVLAQRAARRNGTVVGGEVGEVEGFCIDLTVFHRTCVVTYQTAYFRSRAVQRRGIIAIDGT